MTEANNAEKQAPPEGAVDERWEFNAPRYYDFQAVDDENVCSPAAHRDGWFDTSQTAGAQACDRLSLPFKSLTWHLCPGWPLLTGEQPVLAG